MMTHRKGWPRLVASSLYLIPLVLTALLSVDCNRKGANDYLAAGDEAMQIARLADAESDYQQAAKVAPNDARPYVALGSLYMFEHKAASGSKRADESARTPTR